MAENNSFENEEKILRGRAHGDHSGRDSHLKRTSMRLKLEFRLV